MLVFRGVDVLFVSWIVEGEDSETIFRTSKVHPSCLLAPLLALGNELCKTQGKIYQHHQSGCDFKTT